MGRQCNASINMVCFGDSITEGYMVPSSAAWPSVLERLAFVKTFNLGVSGDTTFDALRRLDQALEPASDIAFIEFGINDFFMGLSIESVSNNLAAIMKPFLAMGTKVILAGFYFEEPGIQAWAAMYRELSQRFSTGLYENIFDGLQDRKDHFLSDGLHPNARGYQVIAERICTFLKERRLIVSKGI